LIYIKRRYFFSLFLLINFQTETNLIDVIFLMRIDQHQVE